MVIQVRHSRLGTLRSLGSPVKLSGSDGKDAPDAPAGEVARHDGPAGASGARGAPVLGEHTREVLGEAGYTEAEVDRLIREGVAVAG
jgi:crotonobetainyl-CoA:carnitine CoA-transferase CaiB-like acyl-CoA transferase